MGESMFTLIETNRTSVAVTDPYGKAICIKCRGNGDYALSRPMLAYGWIETILLPCPSCHGKKYFKAPPLN